MIRGFATPEGTERFAARAVDRSRLPRAHFRSTTERQTLSSFGLGTYIGLPDDATDRSVEAAARECLTTGCINVLDTAINYRHQRAERSLGRAIRSAIDAGVIRRDEIFVATKSGYLAPDAESSIPTDRWVESELVAKGVLDPADIVDGSHAMSVRYLADQLDRSRRNLGLESVDLVYLHNAVDAQLPSVGREEFWRRLGEAFRFYEGRRSAGQVGSYGLATWDCLRTRRSAAGYCSLEEVVALATDIGGVRHGFRFVQFPFNIGMPEAAMLRNQVVKGERATLFEAAMRLGVGCFTSVPLFQGQLARSGPQVDGFSAAQTAIQFARSAPGTLGPLIGQKQRDHLKENLRVAEVLPWDAEGFARALR